MPDSRVAASGSRREDKAERRQVTVLFADLVGSTELASSLDPEDWRGILRAYHRRVAEVVADHGGLVRQFHGDGALAFFGYPTAVETSGRDAVGAGLAVVEAMAGLETALDPGLGVSRLEARVGIDTGVVIVAASDALGGGDTPDVFGEVPNLASRLQGVADPGQVVISAATASLARGFFELELLPPLSLKGVSHPVSAYRVNGTSGARNRLEANVLVDFVARSDEWAWLEGHMTAAASGPARCVLVTGEPGIGKSRLMLEFSRYVAGRGGTVASVHCNPADFLSPLQPFGPLMGGVPTDPDVAARWVERNCAASPTILVVEDVHWADPSTLEAVGRLAQRDLRLLMVLTTRPDMTSQGRMALPPHDELVLDRLLPPEATMIVARVPGGSQLADHIARALVERADGVPLYLEELTRSVIESGLDPDAIPVTLAEVITARLDRLGGARDVAQIASVIGRQFEKSLLVQVSDLNAAAVSEHLERLVEQAVIESPGAQEGLFCFRHALIHEAAYRSLTRADRRSAHSRVAGALLLTAKAQSQPQVIAHHLGRAGRYKEAAEMWRQASKLARRNSHFREAAGHERELLRLIPNLPEVDRDVNEMHCRRRLAICLTTVDQSTPEALAEAERALELATRLGDDTAVLELHLVLVPWWQAQADYRSIDDALPGAIALAARVDNPWFARMLTLYQATMRVWQGRLPEALDRLSQGWAASGLPVDSRLPSAPAGNALQVLVLASLRVAAALAWWLSGDVRTAWDMVHDTLRFAGEQRVPAAQAVTSATAAILAQLEGNRELTAQLARAAEEVPDEIATLQWRRWAAVLRWWADGGVDVPPLPGPMLRPYFQLLRTERAGLPAGETIAVLGEALATVQATGERFCEAEILRARARAWHEAGHAANAAADLAAAQAASRDQQARSLELRALNDRVVLLGDHGALDDIRRLLGVIAGAGPVEDVSLASALLAASPPRR